MAYSKEKLYTKNFAELIKRSSTYSRIVLNGLADKGILKKVVSSPTDSHQYYIFKEAAK